MGKVIVVVGGGFAGLGAARALADGGQHQVVMLEGGQRVGGRANTRDVPGLGRVEFGATYFHGLEGHPLYTAALQKGLMNPIEMKDYCWGFVAEGSSAPLSTAEQQQVSRGLKAFDKAVEESVAAGEKQESYTIGRHLQHTLEQSLQGVSAEGRALLLKAWRWHEIQLRINTAAPSSTLISTEWWADYEELIGPNVPITCGFQAVAESLAEGLDIRFGHVVDTIQWDEARAKLHCTNGAAIEADAVIVTVSLGVLKAKHQELFQPCLPSAKADAIQALGFGLCEKIFMRLQPPMEGQQWAPQHQQPCVAHHLLWDIPFPDSPDASSLPDNGQASSDKTNGTRPHVPAWATGLFSFRFGGSEFKPPLSTSQASDQRSFPRGKYTGEGGRMWGNSSGEVAHTAGNHEPSGLGTASAEGQQCACLWLAGSAAQAMDRESDAQVVEGLQSVLKAFPALPQGDSHRPQTWRSQWGLDPLFLGSYSYMSGEAKHHHVRALAEPVEGKLFFAGEATTSKHMGTMHGAYLTGLEAAKAVIDSLRLSKL